MGHLFLPLKFFNSILQFTVLNIYGKSKNTEHLFNLFFTGQNQLINNLSSANSNVIYIFKALMPSMHYVVHHTATHTLRTQTF